MKTELIYQGGSSNKFWNITIEGNTHTVTYGRAGTKGTSTTKEFADEAATIKSAEKLIKGKIRKGYVEATVKNLVVRDAYNLAGKPIKTFGSTMNPDSAVKVLSEYDEKLKVVDKLDKLAKHSNIAEMDTLVIGAWQDAQEDTVQKIVDKLIEYKSVFSGLKHLFIGDMDSEECEMSWIQQADYTNFYEHFPALETFGVRGGSNLTLGTINLPNLKNLIIETGGLDAKVLEDIAKSKLTTLEYLEIWLGTEDYGGTVKESDLKPILEGDFPNLKYLGLKNYDFQSELAKQLQGAAILNAIDILDLSMGILKDDGAEALYKNEALLNLKHINCRRHYISSEWQSKLKEKFAAQNINLSDAEDAYEYDEEEAYYYVEIGE